MAAKILVLLEHPEPMAQIAECLEQFGHVVVKADTYQDAMDLLRHTDVDLIISDVHLQNGGSIFDFPRWAKATGICVLSHLSVSVMSLLRFLSICQMAY